MKDSLLKLEAEPLARVLDEATGLLKELADIPKEIIDNYIDLFKPGVELFSINPLPTVGADELWFSLQPCDRLFKLVAALRALNRDGSAGVQMSRHVE